MNIARCLTLASVIVFGTNLLHAQSGGGPGTPNFNIGVDGWLPGQSFSATTNTDNNDNEFLPGQLGTCVNGAVPPACDDPLIHFNVGGDPTAVGSTFGFMADNDGGGTFDFVNDGPSITNVLITTTITPDQQNEVFTCTSDEFSFCGFMDPDQQLEIFFSNPLAPEGIPSAVPEPSAYTFLLIASGALVAAHLWRKRTYLPN